MAQFKLAFLPIPYILVTPIFSNPDVFSEFIKFENNLKNIHSNMKITSELYNSKYILKN